MLVLVCSEVETIKKLIIKNKIMKHYKLIIHGDNRFSISNETDSDIMTDYFPGIWSINSQKQAMKYSKEYVADGNKFTITDYDNPKYHALANKFIKELGLSQELFPEPDKIPESTVTDYSVPSNLSQLKKYLTEGKELTIKSLFKDEERKTFVRSVHSDHVVVDKSGGKSWMYFGKASEWTFDNLGATQNEIDREGKIKPVIRIEYIKN